MEVCSSVRQQGIFNYTKHPLYYTWRMMNYRCFSDVHGSFATYGGAGITVCEDWRWDNPSGMANFVGDVGERPDGCTLDRIDSYGSYTKTNWRWADKRTQQNNCRNRKDSESGHTGVVRDSTGKRWTAQITLCEEMHCINIYKELQDAIAARDKIMSIKMEYGDESALAYLNANSALGLNGKRAYARKTSKYYGVSYHKERGLWRAVVPRTVNGKLVQNYLGRFADEEDAHKAVLAFLEKEQNENQEV